MASLQPKTLAPLLILRILEEYSDEKHPITREEIERILDEEYGITMERKAFFRHIKNLQGLKDEGIYVYRTVVKSKDPEEAACAGFYLGDRKFNELELRIIIDALAGSHYLSQRETEELVKQLAGLGSRYFQSKMKAYQFSGRGGKTGNENLMFNLEIIDEAIFEHKQISFDILCINSRGEQVASDRPKVVCTPIRYFVKDRNKDLRDEMRIANVRQWEVADAIGVSEMTMVKWLRKELDDDKKALVREGIAKAAQQHKKNT